MAATNPFFKRKFTCPVCTMEFTTLAIRSSSVYVERRESDFHTVYKGVSPLHYSIVVCPTCEYAASTNVFSKELPARQVDQLGRALMQLKENNLIFTQERDLQTVMRSFQLAVRSAQLRKVSPGELAGLLLGVAWIAREMENYELETVYLQEALNCYLQAYQKGFVSIGNMSDVQAAFLIGELYRRTGDSSQAIYWFNQVIVHKNIKSYPVEEKQAREMWSLAKESLGTGQTGPAEATANKPALPEVKIAEAHKENKKPPVPTAPRKRTTLQMNVGLYSDQIEWLTGIVNQGYNHSKCLVTKEQVLRSLIDALMEVLKENPPEHFASEQELKNCLIDSLKH